MRPSSTAQRSAIDVASVYRAAVAYKTGGPLQHSPVYDPAAGTLTATNNGELNVGRTMAVGERLLVALQGDLRWGGIYFVTSVGGSGLTWQLTRTAETLVGGMALTSSESDVIASVPGGHRRSHRG
jgi:hypothetical protein